MAVADRVFTDEELAEMGARTLDLLTQAIRAGDKAQAGRLAQRMYSECIFRSKPATVPGQIGRPNGANRPPLQLRAK